MKYIAVRSYDTSVFNAMVSRRLSEGWQLNGGVAIGWGGNDFINAQAMIKIDGKTETIVLQKEE